MCARTVIFVCLVILSDVNEDLTFKAKELAFKARTKDFKFKTMKAKIKDCIDVSLIDRAQTVLYQTDNNVNMQNLNSCCFYDAIHKLNKQVPVHTVYRGRTVNNQYCHCTSNRQAFPAGCKMWTH